MKPVEARRLVHAEFSQVCCKESHALDWTYHLEDVFILETAIQIFLPRKNGKSVYRAF